MDDLSGMNSCSYRSFDDDDDVNVNEERRNDSSCHRGTSNAIGVSTAEDPLNQHELRVEVDVVACANPPIYYCSGKKSSRNSSISTTARSIRSISKDVIRTFQTTIQNNSRSQILMPENAPLSPMFQPRLQKLASETRRIVQSVQQNAIVEGVSDTLVNVNDKLGSMLMMRSSKSIDTNTSTSSNIERGIYSSQSMRSWGSTVTAEISTFTSQKVGPLFKRQNTYPVTTSGASASQMDQHVSFDYQLMKDNE